MDQNGVENTAKLFSFNTPSVRKTDKLDINNVLLEQQMTLDHTFKNI